MEQMINFTWTELGSDNPQKFVLFPDDAKFEKVKQTQDRVYLLEIKATQQRHFYWFQEDDTEKDAEICKKIHNAINGIAE